MSKPHFVVIVLWGHTCNLDMLYKLQKQVCSTIGPTLAVSLEPLAHCQL